MRPCAIALFLVLAGCPSRHDPPRPAPAPSATAVASIAASASASGSASDWPIPIYECSPTRCTADGGVPGIRCSPTGRCLQPCPDGMASDAEGRYCNARCKTDADCRAGGRAGRCTQEGICDRVATPPLTCDDPNPCKTARGEPGFRCPGGACRPLCKPGLKLYGGTDCGKPCKKDADCPGGSCPRSSEDDNDRMCLPLCPSEGCPYLWE